MLSGVLSLFVLTEIVYVFFVFEIWLAILNLVVVFITAGRAQQNRGR